jgi:protein-tyrosine-phosphatase
MAKAKLEAAGIPADVTSAGTLQINGQPAAPNAVFAGELIGIDITSHSSLGVSLQMASVADCLVAMAPHHANELAELDSSLEDKIVRLWTYGEHVDPLVEIADPVGQDLEAFVECGERLDVCLDSWIAQL